MPSKFPTLRLIAAAVASAAILLSSIGLPAASAIPLARSSLQDVVTAGDARFEVLSATLIRTEYAGNRAFVDGSTFNVIGRKNFAPVRYTTSRSNGWLTIDTGAVRLAYKVGSGPFDGDNLIATLHTGEQRVVAHPWSSRAVCNVDTSCAVSDRSPADCVFGTVCQAERSKLVGEASVATDHNGYSADGFIAQLTHDAGFVTRTVDTPSAGRFALQLRYASAVGDRPVSVAIGEAAPISVTLAKTSGWDAWRTVAIPVDLAAGVNEIHVTCPAEDGCRANIDTLAIAAVGSPLLAPHAPLGGYRRSVDYVNGAALTSPGLLYQDGWYLLNDSPSALYDRSAGTVTPRDDHDGQPYQDGYLFGYGQDYGTALSDLAILTGPTLLLPRWAYGVWYSEYYDHTAADFENVIIPKFRSEGVPLDVLVSDTDIKSPGTWNGWQIDTSKFPDPQAFFEWSESQGIHNSVNIHPSIMNSDPQFAGAQATAKNTLEKDNSGCPGARQGGADCYPFDWSNPDQLSAYFDLHQKMETQGVDFWWLDWCCEQSKASQKGVTPDAWINQQYASDTSKLIGRGFAFARAFGSLVGTENVADLRTGPWADKRTTVHFTGDTTSSWQTLAMEVGYTPAESASTGLSAVSHDIGGFNNDGTAADGAEPGSTKLPDDLYARWVQLGTFQPIDRLHSNHGDRLPWQYGTEARSSAEKFLNLRENLVPYSYGLAEIAARTGIPVTRPLYLQYPQQQDAYAYASSEYLYGSDMLVAPVTSAGTAATTVWFPAGSSWTDWFTGTTYAGGTTAVITSGLETMPVFVRSGGIVTTRSNDVTNDVQNSLSATTVTVGGGEAGTSSLDEDDGVTTTSSESTTTPIVYTEQGALRTLAIGAQVGRFDGQVTSRAWTAKFLNAVEPRAVSVNGAEVATTQWDWNASARTLTVSVPEASTASAVTVSYTNAAATVTPDVSAPGTPSAPVSPRVPTPRQAIPSPLIPTEPRSAVTPETTAPQSLTPTASPSVPKLTVRTPKIAGKAKVGRKLTAKVGKWKTSGVTTTYRWYRSGKPIKGATKSTYRLTKADIGTTIRVKVTGKKPGYATVVVTSKATKRIRR